MLNILENSKFGTCISQYQTGNITLADDIALSASSPRNLQKMLDLTYKYTCQYRYIMNADKSHIIIFPYSRSSSPPAFLLGNQRINVSDAVRHVGVYLNNKLSDTEKVQNGCNKAKSALFSVLSIINSKYVNPITSASIVSKVCIPRLLFGAELWNHLKQSDILLIERFLRFAAKKVQHFPVRTRTDICLSMLGWHSMLSEVEKRKLSFLGNLCRMPSNVLCKKIFNFRLALYTCNNGNHQKGYIPDIISILQKYNLAHHLIHYIQTGDFLSKPLWRKLYK